MPKIILGSPLDLSILHQHVKSTMNFW